MNNPITGTTSMAMPVTTFLIPLADGDLSLGEEPLNQRRGFGAIETLHSQEGDDVAGRVAP
jgi:hypothetical protein